ncbi:hypothetical protein [uncultured Algibacter sp.]|uniref:hypothetical protein n=1 Tax=uncultured Algibacter sp. TaxID=298659 RepID=UPI003217B238
MLKNKKTIILLALVTLFIACNNALEKTYSKASKTEDLNKISNELSNNELTLLKTYIDEAEAKNEFINTKTYARLLIEAEEQERIILENVEEKIQKELDSIKAEKTKQIIEEKTKLLCANKWKIQEYAFQIEIPRKTEENIEAAKHALNKSMFIKDSELKIDVYEDDKQDIYVKGALDEKLTTIFNGNGKRYKKYDLDGTYKDVFGDEITTGTWEFSDVNTIREKRPSESFSSYKKHEIKFLQIKILEDNIFRFYEKDYDAISRYSSRFNTTSTLIVMQP